MSFGELNYLAIIVAAIAGFAVSGIWYLVFSRAWLASQNLTEEALIQRSPSFAPFGSALIANLLMAAALACLVETISKPTIAYGVVVATIVWFGFVATVIWVNNHIANRKPMLAIITAGNWLAVLIVMGAVIGAFG